MNERKSRKFVCDFETTVYPGQVNTEVWAAACVELYSEDVQIFGSIEDQFNYFVSLDCNVVAYYHNLKFDGSFWLSYLMCDLEYQQATIKTGERVNDVAWIKDKLMLNKTFKYNVSDKGAWYTIVIKTHGHYIEIRDSLKLLPFTVKRIGKAFKTQHQKLEMEYTGFRYAGCEITPEERKYIANDVLVVKEALEIMFDQGHNRLTIGSCCLEEYKQIFLHSKNIHNRWTELFPDVYQIPLDPALHGFKTAGEWIRMSYRGGWCYLARGKENKIYHNGTTADVNSLYPSMMSSGSGNRYPVGVPFFWSGNYIPDEAQLPGHYYFVRIKTRFYIKPGMLPFIQIKRSLLYRGTEMLETSDVYDRRNGKFYTHWTDINGQKHDTRVELTLTMTDFIRLKRHYDLVDFEIIDGCWFYTQRGIFDDYIEKYKKIKLESTGAMRELAKLFLNNLYGKMAATDISSFKYAYLKDNGVIGFYPVSGHDKKPGYIPVGSAITSYARDFTIKAAQLNYHGPEKPGFIYADTDSIHCDLLPEEVKGIKVHDKNFCCWKLESCWDNAIFVRQKTYIEHITHEDLHPIESPYYNIKCAGMNQKCKDLLTMSLTGEVPDSYDLNEEDKQFLYDNNGNLIRRDLHDFKVGLTVPGKLQPKRIPGGILLKESTYEMR